jgi:hypothetical protein
MLALLSSLLIIASPVLWWTMPSYDRWQPAGVKYLFLFGLGIGTQLYLNRLLIYFYFVGGYYWS